MAVERGIRATWRYRWDEVLSGGAGRQLLLLFVLTMLVVVLFTGTVMVLGDAAGEGSVEESDTRAIIALLLLRDFRQRAGVEGQKVCSEILDPKNRELAATTEIRDVVISNVVVSQVLAQVTYEPRTASFVPKPKDRLVVLAEDDG